MKTLFRAALVLAAAAPLHGFAQPVFQTPLQPNGALFIYATNPDNQLWHCVATWTLTYTASDDGQTTTRNQEFVVPPSARNKLAMVSSVIEGTNFQLTGGPSINCK